MASSEAAPELFYVELNPQAKETIVFMHGMTSSHLENARVTPHLSDYHLLLVDLNGHSNSAAIGPFTMEAMADNVAALIRRRAHGGTAHIVSMSMGGNASLDLCRRHAPLVRSAFVSGATVLEGSSRWMLARPRVVWCVFNFFWVWLPWGFVRWTLRRQGLTVDEEYRAVIKSNVRWEVLRDAAQSMLWLGWDEMADIKTRTLLVAGAKGDNVSATKRAGEVLREKGNVESRAVVVKAAQHAWNLQFPELFARGARAWFEGKELPAEFEEL